MEDANSGRFGYASKDFAGDASSGGIPVGALRYEGMHIEHSNAVLIREDALAFLRLVLGASSTSTIVAEAESKWRLGYLCHPLARHLYGQEFEARLDVRSLADPAVASTFREQRARAWLEREAPGVGIAGG